MDHEREWVRKTWGFFNISWKESLNSDGQQFNQYQQNEQSPITSTQYIVLHLIVEPSGWISTKRIVFVTDVFFSTFKSEKMFMNF